MTSWLAPEQVERLTGRRQAAAQCRALARMGVSFAVSATGEPLVDASAYFTEAKPRKKPEPNWGAIRGRAA